MTRWLCCVENTVEDRIMDSGASFHATYCKEEFERFKLRFGKVRLAYDKTLDIVDVGDVVLKTSFSTSWTLKDILGLKRRLISVGQLNEEGYHHEILGDMSRIGMSMLASKGNVLDVRKVDIYFCKPDGLGKQKNLSFIMSEKTMKLQRAESTGIRVEAPKMLWADSVSTAYLIYRIPYVSIGLRILEEEWRGKDTSLTHLKVFGCDSFVKVKDIFGEAMKYSIYGAKSAINSSSLTKPIQKSQVVLVDISENLAENDSIVAEHGLSSEITQSLDVSSDTGERSENSKSFEDSGRSEEEYSEDGASSKEGGSESPQVRRSTRESMAPEVRISAGKKASQRLWMFKIKDEQNSREKMKDRCSEKKVLGYVLIVGVITVDWAKLVRILISEGSLSLLKILETKSLAVMFTRIPCIKSLLALRLVGAACSVCSAIQKGLSSSIIKRKVVRSFLLETESGEVISLQVGDC
ncbi:hypothetical protein Tco_1167633 [Tanacetum coccineum]